MRQPALTCRTLVRPFIRDTGKHWAHRDRAACESTVREVVFAVAQAYGIRNPPRVKFRAMEGSAGRYNARTNTVIIDPESDLFKWGEDLRGTIVSVAVEEAVHAYQWRLTNDRWRGNMNAGDPRLRQAEPFALDGGGGSAALRPSCVSARRRPPRRVALCSGAGPGRGSQSRRYDRSVSRGE